MTARPHRPPFAPTAARRSGLRLAVQGSLLALAALLMPTAGAQEATPAAASQAAGPAAAAVKTEAPAPGWRKLSPAQQQALQPLAATWDSLTTAHQRKWLELSKNYPHLQPAEQATMHERMREWAALTPHERAKARLNFGKTVEIARELSPSEKLARWQAYQALPPEERQKLAEQAKPRPLGVAPAVKPVAPQKLAVVPPVATAKAAKPAEPAAPAAQAVPAAAETPASN